MFKKKKKEINTELDELLNKDYEVPEEIEEMAEHLSGGWWNYRIIEKTNTWEGVDKKTYTDTYYEIHEVYYNGRAEIWGWTQNPMSLWFEDGFDAKQSIKNIKKAMKHTILKLTTKENGDETLIDTGKYIKHIKI